MRRAALACGRTNLVIVNTCAVTAEAARQARQAIRRVKRERPGAEIVVTGCAAQIDPAQFAAMPEVFRVIGNAEKADPASWARGGGVRMDVSNIMAAKAAPTILSEGIEDHTRAFLAVQTGCDHRCSFCVIPFGRGPSRSVPPDEIFRAAQRLTEQRLSRDRPDRRRSDLLWRGFMRRPGAWRTRQIHLARGAKTRTAAAFLDRLHRGGRRTYQRVRRRAAPDAASPSLAAIRRRSYFKAHEAAPWPRRCRALLRRTAPAAAGDRVWRRSDRGLSDRDRSHVSKYARACRGLRPDASACVSVFRAARNAGRENAACRAGDREGKGQASPRGGRGSLAQAS